MTGLRVTRLHIHRLGVLQAPAVAGRPNGTDDLSPPSARATALGAQTPGANMPGLVPEEGAVLMHTGLTERWPVFQGARCSMEQRTPITPASHAPPPDANTTADRALSPGLRAPGCAALQVAGLNGRGLPRQPGTLSLLHSLLDAGPVRRDAVHRAGLGASSAGGRAGCPWPCLPALGLRARVKVAGAPVGRPWLALAHVVRVGLMVDGAEHQAGLVTSATLHAAVTP